MIINNNNKKSIIIANEVRSFGQEILDTTYSLVGE